MLCPHCGHDGEAFREWQNPGYYRKYIKWQDCEGIKKRVIGEVKK